MTKSTNRGVAIVPVYNGKFVLLKQLRPPYKLPFLNIVMGGIKKGETPATAAKRECLEEIGSWPKKLIKLGRIIQLPGGANVETTIFFSEFKNKPAVPKDTTESIIGLEFYSKTEIAELIKKNKLVESTTLLALLLAMKR